MPSSTVRPEPSEAAELRLTGVVVEHRRGRETPFRALEIADLTIPAGGAHGFAGPSGAGKSTLLNAVAGLLRPTAGEIAFGAIRIDRLGAAAAARFRRTTIGFVFQDFHLVDELDVLDNVLLPARFYGFRLDPAVRVRADGLIARMGLDDPRRRAGRLSRGERQRVAVARALIGNPRLILADEPTASLDAAAGAEVGRLLVEEARRHGATLLVASHDPTLLGRLDRVHRLVGGRPVAEETP